MDSVERACKLKRKLMSLQTLEARRKFAPKWETLPVVKPEQHVGFQVTFFCTSVGTLVILFYLIKQMTKRRLSRKTET